MTITHSRDTPDPFGADYWTWVERVNTALGYDHAHDLLTMREVADEITMLTGRATPYARSTISHYRRVGTMPIPDDQEGGHTPTPGETIKWTGRKGRHINADGTIVFVQAATERIPREGELIGGHPRWYRWRIWRWQLTERPGSGWHATGKDRKRYVDRTPGAVGWVAPAPEKVPA